MLRAVKGGYNRGCDGRLEGVGQPGDTKPDCADDNGMAADCQQHDSGSRHGDDAVNGHGHPLSVTVKKHSCQQPAASVAQ